MRTELEQGDAGGVRLDGGGDAARGGVAAAERSVPAAAPPGEVKADVRGLNFFYGSLQALKDINIAFPLNRVTAIIGPSGCGKSTLLRCFNRIHDLYPDTRYEGRIMLQPSGVNIIDPATDPVEMRMRIGMVFQKPNAFPKSIFENVAFGPRLLGEKRAVIEEKAERALRSAALWD